MASRALLIAAVAAGLLVVSVGVDLAFNSTLQVRAAKTGDPLQLVGEGQLDGRLYGGPSRSSQTFRANASDTITVEVTFQNAYPWPSTKTFILTRDGCYDGATELAELRITAPASGEGKASTDLSVERLLREYGLYFPKEAGTPAAQPIYLQVCRGTRDAVTATFGIEEVPK